MNKASAFVVTVDGGDFVDVSRPSDNVTFEILYPLSQVATTKQNVQDGMVDVFKLAKE